jgi:hypothetical protein
LMLFARAHRSIRLAFRTKGLGRVFLTIVHWLAVADTGTHGGRVCCWGVGRLRAIVMASSASQQYHLALNILLEDFGPVIRVTKSMFIIVLDPDICTLRPCTTPTGRGRYVASPRQMQPCRPQAVPPTGGHRDEDEPGEALPLFHSTYSPFS